MRSSRWWKRHMKQQRMWLCSPLDVSTVAARPHKNTQTYTYARAHTHTQTHTTTHTNCYRSASGILKYIVNGIFIPFLPFFLSSCLWHERGRRKRPSLSIQPRAHTHHISYACSEWERTIVCVCMCAYVLYVWAHLSRKCLLRQTDRHKGGSSKYLLTRDVTRAMRRR
jgi:hypothetical protein